MSTAKGEPETLQVVTIDGPSGAGKSTIAKALAARLGWKHLDTGAMYRAVTLELHRRGVDLGDSRAVQEVLDELELVMGKEGKVFLNGEEVSGLLRSPEVEEEVSAVSALPMVRERMKELQRREARKGPLVAEGRDMGSVVFPDAEFQFYLDASPAERARRRKEDFEAQGRSIPMEKVLAEIQRRDERDSTRSDAPLVRTPRMKVIDSTGMGVDEVLELMEAQVRSREKKTGEGDGG